MKVTAQAERNAIAAAIPNGHKDGPWWADPGLRTLNFLLFIPLMSEYIQGYDSSLINNIQELTEWQDEFHHPSGSLLGILSASYWVGNILGVFLITVLSDKLGRRHAMFIGSVVCIIGTSLVVGAVDAGMFIAGRLLLGIGGVIVGAIGPVMVGELAHPSQRATATALSNTQYSSGAIIAAWVTFGSFHIASTWAWRLPALLQALPSVLQAVGIYFLPESPRWLIANDQSEKALHIFARYHANGDREDPVVLYEFEEAQSTIKLEIAARQTKWSELWSTPGNRWRSFVMIWCGICKQWSGNGLISYYLHSMLDSVGITTQLDQTLITATSNMFSFACSVAFAFLPARFGRRPLLLWSMALMWVVFTSLTITTGYFETHPNSKASSYATVAFIYLFSGVHNLGWTGAVMVYVTEVLPYSLRAKGVSLYWLLTGAAGAFNTYVNPLGIDAFGWKYYLFYVGWIAIQFAVVYFVFTVETKGLSLEAVALLVDGKNARVGRVNAAAQKLYGEEGDKDGKADKDAEVRHVETVHVGSLGKI